MAQREYSTGSVGGVSAPLPSPPVISSLLLPSGQSQFLPDSAFNLTREEGWRLPEMRLTGIRLVASGGSAVLLNTSDGKVVRWATGRSDSDSSGRSSAQLIDLETKDVRLDAMYMDPTGCHSLFVGSSGGGGKPRFSVLYNNTHSRAAAGRAREVAEDVLRGEKIECVAWSLNSSMDEATALLGTASGLILELKVEERAVQTCRQVWRLPDAQKQPILAIRWDSFPSGAGASGKDAKFFATVVTGDRSRVLRVFHFLGGPKPEALFAHGNASGSERGTLIFQELLAPPGAPTLENPTLQFFTTAPAAATAMFTGFRAGGLDAVRSDIFALTTHLGLFTGRLNLSTGVNDVAHAVVTPQLVPYPIIQAGTISSSASSSAKGGPQRATRQDSTGSTGSISEFPMSMAVTDYHYVLLYKHRLIVMSRVSSTVVFEMAIPEDRYGTMKGMCVDAGFGTRPSDRAAQARSIWLFSERSLLELVIRGEDQVGHCSFLVGPFIWYSLTWCVVQDAWKLFVLKGDFDAALRLAGADADRLTMVYVRLVGVRKQSHYLA
jgi:hypothetical protein